MKIFKLIVFSILFVSCSQAQDKSENHSNSNFEIVKTDAQWKKELAPEAYKVLCGGATERAFTGKYLYHKGKGNYACAACNNPLFSSETKFQSGSGWPSFFDQINDDAIIEKNR